MDSHEVNGSSRIIIKLLTEWFVCIISDIDYKVKAPLARMQESLNERIFDDFECVRTGSFLVSIIASFLFERDRIPMEVSKDYTMVKSRSVPHFFGI